MGVLFLLAAYFRPWIFRDSSDDGVYFDGSGLLTGTTSVFMISGLTTFYETGDIWFCGPDFFSSFSGVGFCELLFRYSMGTGFTFRSFMVWT